MIRKVIFWIEDFLSEVRFIVKQGKLRKEQNKRKVLDNKEEGSYYSIAQEDGTYKTLYR